MTKGLYFYKLVSPYSEDVTKDCKLTINEIDSNFLNLKNADIKEVYVDEDKRELILSRNNGEELVMNISKVIPEMEVEYDSIDGVLTIEYDGEKHLIEGLITKDNLSKEILTKVYTDSTLSGIGTSKAPLHISPVHETGYYKPVKRVINTLEYEKVPTKHLVKGDRFVVLEKVQDFGLLYDFQGVKHIKKLLENSGWRVPSKDDWDDMLNALEPCEYRNHNSALNNNVLGKMAGSLLKSVDEWRTGHCGDHCHDHKHNHHDDCGHKHCNEKHEYYNIACECDLVEEEKECKTPCEKPIKVSGKDAFGMSILPSGYGHLGKPCQYNQFGYQGAFWTTDLVCDTNIYTKVFEAEESGVMQRGECPASFLSIRLVKDYDGTNYKEIEDILGKNYQTKLVPTLNTPTGFSIWTAQNLDFDERHIETLTPNAGLGTHHKTYNVYFIYEWDGFKWDKKALSEGDSVTILEGKNPNETYRVVNGELINVSELIANSVKDGFKEDIDDIKSRLTDVEGTLEDHENRLEEIEKQLNGDDDGGFGSLQQQVEALEEKLNEEIENRLAVEKDIWDAINAESEAREGVDNLLWEAINTEAANRNEVEGQLWGAINNEAKERNEVDAQLWDAINNEAKERNEVEELLWSAINTETANRNEVEGQLWGAINNEAKERNEVDAQLWDALNEETKNRNEVEGQLWDAINNEAKERDEADKALWDAFNEELNNREEFEREIRDAIDAEIERATEAEQALDAKIIDLEGKTIKKDECSYNAANGTLTLPTVNDENTITVKFSFDFGEC